MALLVEIYGKKDCPLCDEAKAVLARARERVPFDLVEVDVEQDPKLLDQFRDDVPVIFVDGRRAFKHHVDEKALVQRIERGRSFAMGTLDPKITLTRGRPVGRTTKIVFAIVAAASIAGVFGNSWWQRAVVEKRLALRALEIEPRHSPARPFTLEDLDGKARSLSDFRGKVVLLNFWATWCPPCREEMPSMKRLAQALSDRPDFALVAAAEDDDPSAVARFFAGQPPAFPVLLDRGGRVGGTYGTSKYPESYVIDREGNVIAKVVGPRDWSDPAVIDYFRDLAD